MVNSLELVDVHKKYSHLMAVNDVSFNLPTGSLVALVGHNGAGKSTLIKLMLGLIHPTSGEILLHGQRLDTKKAMSARKKIGFLPESVVFEGAMSGREILEFFSRLKGADITKSMQLFDLVGLDHAMDNKVKTYSKGMRQRLGLAQALIGEPDILLLDEPTSGLDPAAQRHFYDIVNDLKAKGASILICSHSLTELEAQADMVAMMNSGNLMICATMEQLRKKANIPINIRIHTDRGENIKIADKLTVNNIKPSYINATHVEIAIDNHDKMAMLKQLSNLDENIIDIDVETPSLDKLYAAFCQREEAGQGQ